MTTKSSGAAAAGRGMIANLAMASLLVTVATAAPTILIQPANQIVSRGGTALFSVTATVGPRPLASSGPVPLTYQWQRNGTNISGATGPTLAVAAVQPDHVGVYAVRVSDDRSGVLSSAAILGLTSTEKVIGAAEEVGPNIRHANGNIYDQLLLEGPAASMHADPDQILRISFIDLDNDIVQVEFSGAGTLTLILDNASGPGAPASYNQGTLYMKGHAGIVIADANENTHLSIFSVGTTTAVNQSLFRGDVDYDGVADVAYVAVASSTSRFGGLRAANASFTNTLGVTGVYAPGVSFSGPVYVGNIAASGTATAELVLGSAADVRLAGGDLAQPNGSGVEVSGMTYLRYTAGTDSHGRSLPAKSNCGSLLPVANSTMPLLIDSNGQPVRTQRNNAFTRTTVTPEPATVEYVDRDGNLSAVTAFPGEISVHAAEGATTTDISTLIAAKAGTIIAQSPAVRFYLAQVAVGREREFIAQLSSQPSIALAIPNPVTTPAVVDLSGLVDANGNLPTVPALGDSAAVAGKARYYQLDDFVNSTLDCNGVALTHGDAVGYGIQQSFGTRGMSLNIAPRLDAAGKATGPMPHVAEVIHLLTTDMSTNADARGVINISRQGETGKAATNPISRAQYERNQANFLWDLASTLNALPDDVLARTAIMVSAGNGYLNRGEPGDGIDLKPVLQTLHAVYPRLFNSLDGAAHMLVVGGSKSDGSKDQGYNYASADTNADPVNSSDHSALMMYAPGRSIQGSASGCRFSGTSFAAPAASDGLLQAIVDNPDTPMKDLLRAHARAAANNGYRAPDKTQIRTALTPEPTSYTLTVNVLGPAGTSVSRSDPGPSYPVGKQVTLTATPFQIFIGWTGALSGNSEIASVTMNADKTVNAVFAYRLTLAVSPTGAGSVTRVPQAATYGNEDVQLTASANSGWRFVTWNGDLTGSGERRTLHMDWNKSVTAVFEREPPPASPFDGVYVGGYTGDARGTVRLSVTGGQITVLEPGSGQGFVGADGSATFSGRGSESGVVYSFDGSFRVLANGGATAGGGWTANDDGDVLKGNWSASR